ncbi:hypothetical protein CVT25_002906 [Psilocybe cyanescens]|uniref:Uncharacterized protein n=1 Tax=Psilocybe cyanescens TaxID=93625 RepID=A0A409X5V4_PSICY|nr:hypothetical protein CVT25_002906 [Psilocybe cyanescens]
MSTGAASPVNQALEHQLRKPVSLALYSIFLLGLVIPVIYISSTIIRTAACALSIASIGMFFALRQDMSNTFKRYLQMQSKGNLADVRALLSSDVVT